EFFLEVVLGLCAELRLLEGFFAVDVVLEEGLACVAGLAEPRWPIPPLQPCVPAAEAITKIEITPAKTNLAAADLILRILIMGRYLLVVLKSFQVRCRTRRTINGG